MTLRRVPWSGWIGWLLAVSIVTWHRPQATAVAYNVAEHRLDYIKLGEGREYNYHYNDGVASGFDKRKFYKRPQLFSKPPYTLKSFPGPVEQIVTNEFQAHPEQTYVKQESLLPVYESHEKSVRYIPLDFGPSRNQILGEFSLPVGHPTNPPLNLAQRVIQMIQLHHPSPSTKNATSGGLGSVSSVHFQVPGQPPSSSSYHSTQHPGSYQYFNAHPVPSGGPAYELVRPISSFPPPRPYLAPALTTTRAPYLAPILQKSTTTTPAPPTGESKPARRPPTPGPTRPYVAPGVTADPLLSSVSLANRLKYTSSQRPTSSSSRPLTQKSGGTRNQQPYEPEFDIDIRIDLRDDSA
ncbi:synapsin-1-like [Anopheles cruzii]|uniref:synapsin-1-like n=1 Tax=Anopheles cruzii TaxID=68878 RepID=UPI0022EC4670|nr:synapsin-1-like [Anopheles cruzii]